jgi:hypothetical protein
MAQYKICRNHNAVRNKIAKPQQKGYMKTPDPHTPTNEDLLRNKVTVLESEIAGLQKDFDRVGKSEEMIRWMVGIFSTVAVMLIGFHVYISNNNYEHERQTLQDQISALSKQITAEQEAADKAFNEKLANIVTQKFDAANAELNQRFNSVSSSVNTQFAEQETNLNAHLQDLRKMTREIGDTASHLNNDIDQKVGLAMASGFINVAANLASYKQYALATQCYLDAAHQFIIGQDFKKLNLCISGLWKTCLPHIKRDEYAGMEKGPYELDLLIYALSSFDDKRYYDEVNSLKYERKRITGEDFPASFKPSIADDRWVQMLATAKGVSQ